MANRLANMLKLQTDYNIPIRMDLSTYGLKKYYESYLSPENEREKEAILNEIIKDLS